MKIICAGRGKTGTKSMAKALRILGYNVYDLEDHFKFHGREWLDAYETDKAPDFHSMYKDVDAVTDAPSNVFFRDILEAFPDSKVILTVRDNEEIWAQSMKGQLMAEFHGLAALPWRIACLPSPTGRRFTRLMDIITYSLMGMKKAEVTYFLKKHYRDHNAFVKSVVRADKLLLYNVKEGWAPLCKSTLLSISQGKCEGQSLPLSVTKCIHVGDHQKHLD